MREDEKVNEKRQCGKKGLSPSYGVCESEKQVTLLSENREEEKTLPALLLHSCCGPCSTAVIERLSQSYRVTVYFANSNIDEEDEYRRRLDAQKSFIERYNTSGEAASPVTLVVAPYRPGGFLESVTGYENEPEGGVRCGICIGARIELTAAYAAMNGFELFTTTLSVSPHKSYERILRLGREAELRYGVRFLAEDFKKKNGFARSAELAAAYGLYRQSYCGCSFSRAERGVDE